MMIHAADKYDLPRLVSLVCYQLREVVTTGAMIADLLICAYKHGKNELRELALEKIRANKENC